MDEVLPESAFRKAAQSLDTESELSRTASESVAVASDVVAGRGSTARGVSRDASGAANAGPHVPYRHALSRSSPLSRPAQESGGVSEATDNAAMPARGARLVRLAVGAVFAAAFAWAYWPTLVALVKTWSRQPDYSHGFLVAPVAALFLWLRRDGFPGASGKLSWFGLAIVGLALAARFVSARYYFEAIDGWSMALWLAGVILLFAGWRTLWWSLPSVVFLFFMIPLPFRIERALSVPLQSIATHLSCWTLQLLGQPALPRGHTILLGAQRLEVEQACSGLRIFMGFAALAFAYIVVVHRAWWEKAILAASVVPIALFVNMVRIVATGLLYRYVSGDAARHFSHDVAGWMMILLAAVFFAGVLWYLKHLAPEVEVVDARALVRQESS